ncbi:phage tail tape measure protein [Microscilla marina]|uniref:Phage tail tape measure protein n=1 Tax=Microscilla marina ATCC 23134 TaxID=313606 RepID=A1ZLH9_MICM2|nr:hypothetical protein [Microscilla marina]EAY28733.1 hypothetical protein M23134_07831 [Microscilla marina ATCC 23134]
MNISHLKNVLNTYKNVNQKIDEHKKRLSEINPKVQELKKDIESWGKVTQKTFAHFQFDNLNKEVKKLDRNLKSLETAKNVKDRFPTTQLGKYNKQLKDIQALRNKSKSGKSNGYVKGYDKQIAQINRLIKKEEMLKLLLTSRKQMKSQDSNADFTKLDQQIGTVSKSLNRLKKQNVYQGLSKGIQKTFTPLDQLEKKLTNLEKARNKAFSATQIKHYNTQIAKTQKSIDGIKKLQGTFYTNEQKVAAKEKLHGQVAQGVTFLKSAVSEAAKYSDKMVEVAHATGMSQKSLRELQKIHTRTSDSALLDMMKQSTAIPDTMRVKFVQVADKIQSTMGNIFGASPNALAGTMQNMFRNLSPDQAVGMDVAKFTEKIASSMLVLRKQGASATNLFEMLKSTQSLGKLAPANHQLLAMAATLEGVGIKAPQASAALTKIMHGIAANRKNFAGFLGKTPEGLEKLKSGEVLQALIEKLSTLKSPQAALRQLMSLGIKGKGSADAIKVLTQLIQKSGDYQSHLLALKQDLGGVTALTKAYNDVNNSLGGKMAIASKSFVRLQVAIGGMLAPAVEWLAIKFEQLAAFLQTNWGAIKPILLGVAFAIGILYMNMLRLKLALLPTMAPILFLATGFGMLIAAVRTGNPVLFLASVLFLVLTRRIWMQVFGINALGMAQMIAAVRSFSFIKIWKLLNTVMNNNPILRVVMILSLLIAAVQWAYKEFDWFREIVDGFFALLKPVISLIGGLFSGFFSMLTSGFRKTGEQMNVLGNKKDMLNKKFSTPTAYNVNVNGEQMSIDKKMDAFAQKRRIEEKGIRDRNGQKVRGNQQILGKYYITNEEILRRLLAYEKVYLGTEDKKALHTKISQVDRAPRAMSFNEAQAKKFLEDKNVLEKKKIAPKDRTIDSVQIPAKEKQRLLDQMYAHNAKVRKAAQKGMGGFSGTFHQDSKENKKLQGGLQQVSASGVKEKNYHIKIGSFVDGDFVVKSENIETGTQQTYDKFLEMFMRVVNNAQQS